MSLLPVAFLSVVLGLVFQSAAAGLAVLGYGVAAVLGLKQRRARLERQQRQVVSLELISSMAADLRAGSLAREPELPDPELEARAAAAFRVSERTGAGLAAMLERLEAQQRTLSRLDAAAHAQAAGIRLTVLLLLLLPLGALATGQAIGASPLRVLMRTDVGMLCVAGASGLQLTGLAWANRLARPASFQPETELAFAADLVAAALQAGAPVDLAVLAAGDVLTGRMARQLRQVGYALHWGVAASAAWALFLPPGSAGQLPRWPRRQALPPGQASHSPGWARRQALPPGQARRRPRWPRRQALPADLPEMRLIQAAQRSGESGAALAGALTRCADQLRADVTHERQAALQRAGVLLVLPLGACFLPAFLLAGLVPVVIAVLAQVI